MIRQKFIILKTMKYSESDLILQAISQDGEKMGFMAKGALKSKKRFAGGALEPTHFVELTYKENKSGTGLRWIQEVHLLRDFQGIRSSYDKIEFAWSLVEAVYFISQEGDSHSQLLFNLLGHTLATLENSLQLDLLKMHFYLKLLFQQGVILPETWMSEYLKVPMKESATLENHFKLHSHKLPLIEKQVKSYLHSAEFQS